MHAIRYKYSPATFHIPVVWQLNEDRNVEFELIKATDFNLSAPRTELF